MWGASLVNRMKREDRSRRFGYKTEFLSWKCDLTWKIVTTGSFVEKSLKQGRPQCIYQELGTWIMQFIGLQVHRRQRKLEMQRVRGQTGKYLLQMGARCTISTAGQAGGRTVEWSSVGDGLCNTGGELVVKWPADVSINAKIETNKNSCFHVFNKIWAFLGFWCFFMMTYFLLCSGYGRLRV